MEFKRMLDKYYDIDEHKFSKDHDDFDNSSSEESYQYRPYSSSYYMESKTAYDAQMQQFEDKITQTLSDYQS